MNKWLEILLGLILVIIPIVVVFQWLNAGRWDFLHPAWTVLKGGVFWAVVGLGLLFLMLGISDLKE